MPESKDKLIVPKMTPERRIRLSFVSGILFALIIGAMFFFSSPAGVKDLSQESVQQDIVIADTFTYSGQANEDALTILKNKTEVQQATSGLVTSINGRQADPAKKEYWSFYVNGKMAPVGPAEYITEASDVVEWKVESY